jgi:predicted enzyme related to lactoylglutathione lyase
VSLGVTYLFAACAVADLAAALPFYEALFGRVADLEPHDGERCWRLSGSCWVVVVVDAERAGGGCSTALVEDLDAWLAEWSSRGISVDSLESVGGGRKAVVIDPDGNSLGFAQVPSR